MHGTYAPGSISLGVATDPSGRRAISSRFFRGFRPFLVIEGSSERLPALNEVLKRKGVNRQMVRLIKHETPGTPTEYAKPAVALGSFDRAFDRMFDQWPTFLPVRWSVPVVGRMAERYLPVNEYYRDGSLVIRAELPAIDPDKDVDITMTDGMLHIKAERRQEEKVEQDRYLRREIHYGSFERTLALPEGVTEADVTATYKDGILEIVVPPAEKEPAKKIAIAKV
jgi:HSP20 family protein